MLREHAFSQSQTHPFPAESRISAQVLPKGSRGNRLSLPPRLISAFLPHSPAIPQGIFLFLLYIIYHFTPVFPTCVSEPSIRFISAARSSSASLIIHLSMIRHKIKNRKIPMKMKSADSAFIRGNSRKKRTPPVHTQKNIKNRYRILHLVKNLKCILLYNFQTAVRNFRRNRAAKGQRDEFLSISAGFRFSSPCLPSCRPGSVFS